MIVVCLELGCRRYFGSRVTSSKTSIICVKLITAFVTSCIMDFQLKGRSGLLLNISTKVFESMMTYWLVVYCLCVLLFFLPSFITAYLRRQEFEKMPLVGTDNTKLEAAIQKGTKLVFLALLGLSVFFSLI